MAGMAHARTGPVAVDDLALLLPDWRTHLRARNVAPSTIASYLRVGENLLVWLAEAGCRRRRLALRGSTSRASWPP